MVHAFPSLHAAVLFVKMQPPTGSQALSVQTLSSSQLRAAPPTHAPLAQVSAVVHAFPSLQASVLFVKTQPLSDAHESVVQAFPSSQTRGAPDRQEPCTQVSPVVQAFPSEQGSALFVYSHPTAGSQSSVVHGLPSSQLDAAPGRHVPDAH